MVVKTNCIVVETGKNTITKEFSDLIGGFNKSWKGSYTDLRSKYDSDSKWKDAVDDLIKKQIYSWTTKTGTENVVKAGLMESQIENYIKTLGYDASTAIKNTGPDYSWNVTDDSGKVVNYRVKSQVSGAGMGPVATVTYYVVKNDYDSATGETKVSTSFQLKETISKWYRGLRMIALVGLLSVLVYVGIRIIISSTGQEKAKYKKMIGDWVAAICILFILHYIMSITVTVVEQISKVFITNNIIGTNQEDVLMSTIRSSVNTSGTISTTFTELLLYLVLVIYTVVFTIHYLKRLLYLAFFTMIAPLIALTYPLDKIKDGQAQAFSMWLREYIFNSLIPVIHLLIYSIFVGSAFDFAKSNPIYALVCISFMIPAEKFIRKMFGFDKASTVSPLGAAAGGAMVMNAINKIGNAPKGNEPEASKPPKQSGQGAGEEYTGIKSPNRPQALTGEGAGEGPTGNPPAGPSGNPTGTPPTSPSRDSAGNPPTGPSENSTETPGFGETGDYAFNGNDPTYGQTINKYEKSENPGIWSGIKEATGDRFNRKTIKGFAKRRGKKLARLGGKVAGAAALGTFGLAAGLATGDLSNVAKYTGAAGLVGSKLGARGVERATKVEKRTRTAFQNGRLGATAYAQRQTINELKEDRDFMSACKATGVNNPKELIQSFMANGITDKEEISKAVIARKHFNDVEAQKEKAAIKKGETYEKQTMSDNTLVALAKANQEISHSAWGNPETRQKILERYQKRLQAAGATEQNSIKFVDNARFIISDMKG